MEENEAINAFEEFFSEYIQREVYDVASGFPQKRSVNVDLEKLARFNHELADLVTERPDEACGWAEYAIKRIGVPTASGAEFSPHVRFYNLPADPYDVMVQNLGAEHLNKLARVQGVISLISDIKPRMVHALWECLHCESRVKVLSDKGNLVPPGQCNSCGRKGKGIFRLIEKSSEFTNMQNVKLQELVERVRGASPAAQIDLWLEDDLTNMVVPGEKVLVSGILRLRPMITKKGGRSSVYAKFLDVVHVQKLEQEFEEVEISKEEEAQIIELSKNPRLPELIAQSIASGIYGHNEMKQAIALQLFGGTPNKVLPDGQKIRSDIHVLLVGDPGTGKSALMLYVARLAPKCIYVAGASSSAVGLTAAAERDEFGEGWVLKAGALVLASGGMAAIDEFEKMKAEDRGAIHECLEQQYVSIAKAGMVTRFKAQTALLAAANPKFGRFDLTQPVAQQFALEPALLSRFDLIFPVKDVLDETRDRRLAEHIIKGHKSAAKSFKGTPDESIVPPISVDLLRKYIAYARRNTSPELTEEASDKIKEYYIQLRLIGEKEKTFPITARQIEGLIRLAEASAKMRLNNKVELQDAEKSIFLMDYVLKEVFVDRETGKIDYDVIGTGQPKSRTDKMRSILGIINNLEQKFDLVSIEEVVKEAASYGLEEFYARRLIDELERQGDLYEPKTGFIKSARPKTW